jgi:hypothetical protein
VETGDLRKIAKSVDFEPIQNDFHDTSREKRPSSFKSFITQ